jgi:hypothetical protein
VPAASNLAQRLASKIRRQKKKLNRKRKKSFFSKKKIIHLLCACWQYYATIFVVFAQCLASGLKAKNLFG